MNFSLVFLRSRHKKDTLIYILFFSFSLWTMKPFICSANASSHSLASSTRTFLMEQVERIIQNPIEKLLRLLF